MREGYQLEVQRRRVGSVPRHIFVRTLSEVPGTNDGRSCDERVGSQSARVRSSGDDAGQQEDVSLAEQSVSES